MKFRPGVQHVRICSGLVVTLTSAAACTPAPDRATHTVEEYRHERSLRQEIVARCDNDMQLRRSSADCLNALEAERREGIGSLRQLPLLAIPSPAQQTDSRDPKE
jgi:hypothetical protein